MNNWQTSPKSSKTANKLVNDESPRLGKLSMNSRSVTPTQILPPNNLASLASQSANNLNNSHPKRILKNKNSSINMRPKTASFHDTPLQASEHSENDFDYKVTLDPDYQL